MHYRQIDNIDNALRLFTIAVQHKNPLAPCICALLRLSQATSPSINQDLQLVTHYADQGNRDAQEFLAKLYCGVIDPFDTKEIKPDMIRAYRYLEAFVAHDTADATCFLLLAKMLCGQIKNRYCQQNDVRGCTLFAQALKKGYQPTQQEYKEFGILAFSLQYDDLALQCFEQAEPDKTTRWLLTIVYLRHQDPDTRRFKKALQTLSSLLIIEHDKVELPQEGSTYQSFVLETLKKHLGFNDQTQELFCRLCYALKLDNKLVSFQLFMEQAIPLVSSNRLSAWNFIIFLQRHKIKIFFSLQNLLDRFRDSLIKIAPVSKLNQETKEQLELVAQPLIDKNYAQLTKDEIISAIIAGHFLVHLCYKENPLYACNYFILAEEAIISLFPKDHPLLNVATYTGSVDHIAELAHQKNTDAIVTVLMYRGYRISQDHNNREGILQWLRRSNYIVAEKTTYTVGRNKERDTLMANFYTVVGALTILINKDGPLESTKFLHYFKYALALDPTLENAQYYSAFIKLYSTGISARQRQSALKILHSIAEKRDSQNDVPYGVALMPQAVPIPLTPDLIVSGMTLAHDHARQLNSWSFCNLL